jgi:hypothetical protein
MVTLETEIITLIFSRQRKRENLQALSTSAQGPSKILVWSSKRCEGFAFLLLQRGA